MLTALGTRSLGDHFSFDIETYCLRRANGRVWPSRQLVTDCLYALFCFPKETWAEVFIVKFS